MLEISEDDVLDSLRRDNPWWGDSVLPEMYRFSKKRSYFDPFKKIGLDWSIRRTVILMGPRRVGKTVMLYQLIEDLIDSDFSPQRILFISIDTPLYSGLPLEKIMQMFASETKHESASKRLVIFDEIQYLKNWEAHLKVLTDKYPNTRFIASGSAAAALRLKSNESGAGRFTDFFLPPLTFAEFLNFRDVEDKLIQDENVGHTLRFKTNNIEELNKQFIDYLNFGGYPEAVINEPIQENIKRFLGRDIIDKVLLRDLPSLYGIQDIQELNRLFTTIAYHSGQELSLDNLASSSGVAKNTIKRYLEYLEAAFLIERVKRVDESGKTFQRNVNFKVYLTNPSMRAALFSPLSDTSDAMGAMVETAIFSQWFHSEQIRNIHYARWKSGRQSFEVDLVKVSPERNFKPLWAYEVKWSDRYVDQPGELKGLIAFAKKNPHLNSIVGSTTKTRSGETNLAGITVKHFPCSLHCYQIGKNVIEGRPA